MLSFIGTFEDRSLPAFNPNVTKSKLLPHSQPVNPIQPLPKRSPPKSQSMTFKRRRRHPLLVSSPYTRPCKEMFSNMNRDPRNVTPDCRSNTLPDPLNGFGTTMTRYHGGPTQYSIFPSHRPLHAHPSPATSPLQSRTPIERDPNSHLCRWDRFNRASVTTPSVRTQGTSTSSSFRGTPLATRKKLKLTLPGVHSISESPERRRPWIHSTPLPYHSMKIEDQFGTRRSRTVPRRVCAVSSSDDEDDDENGDLDSPIPRSTDRPNWRSQERHQIIERSDQPRRATPKFVTGSSVNVTPVTIPPSIRLPHSPFSCGFPSGTNRLQTQNRIHRSASLPRRLPTAQAEISPHVLIPSPLSECSFNITSQSFNLNGASTPHVGIGETQKASTPDLNAKGLEYDSLSRSSSAHSGIEQETQSPSITLRNNSSPQGKRMVVRSFLRVRGGRRVRHDSCSLRSTITSPSTGRRLTLSGLHSCSFTTIGQALIQLGYTPQNKSQLNESTHSFSSVNSTPSINRINREPTTSKIFISSDDPQHSQWVSRPSLLPGDPIRSTPLPRRIPHQMSDIGFTLPRPSSATRGISRQQRFGFSVRGRDTL